MVQILPFLFPFPFCFLKENSNEESSKVRRERELISFEIWCWGGRKYNLVKALVKWCSGFCVQGHVCTSDKPDPYAVCYISLNRLPQMPKWCSFTKLLLSTYYILSQNSWEGHRDTHSKACSPKLSFFLHWAFIIEEMFKETNSRTLTNPVLVLLLSKNCPITFWVTFYYLPNEGGIEIISKLH